MLHRRLGTARVGLWSSLLIAGLILSWVGTVAAASKTIAPELPGLLPEPKPAHPMDRFVDPHGPGAVKRSFRLLSNWPPVDPDPAYDVLHYDLDLAFELGGYELIGTATLTILWGSDPDDVLTLDLTTPVVSAVFYGGSGGTSLSFVKNASTLDITIVPAPSSGDTVTVAIDYEAVTSPSYFTGPNESHTFTEPEGSRAWFPCNDVPWDKASLTVAGSCLAGETLVSNGTLDSTATGFEFGAPIETFYWREDTPIATYLVSINVGNFSALASPSPITPMTWYVYPFHATAALNAFINVDEMVAFYDSTLAPWPHDKYAQVEGQFGGGMEHQTCSLMAEFIVTTGLTYEWITAHELAHQYFGDWVTMESWQHIWLNEGFATFFDRAWEEDFYGAATFKSRMDSDEVIALNFETNTEKHPIVDPPPNRLFSSLVYYKGSWVLRMLRDLVGKPVFDAAISDYVNTYGGGNANTDQLLAKFNTHYGQDLTWYFDQWLYGTGSPQLVYVPILSQIGGNWLVQLDVTQVHGTPTVFRIPIEVQITTTAGVQLETAWIDSEHQVLSFPVSDQPLSVLLDPDNKILGTMSPGVAAAVEPSPAPAAAGIRAWPNPFGQMLWVAGPDRPVDLDVFDVRGRRVRELGSWEAGATPLRWTGTDDSGRRLAPGLYFIRTRDGSSGSRVVLLPR